jgi:hypothetical protein
MYAERGLISKEKMESQALERIVQGFLTFLFSWIATVVRNSTITVPQTRVRPFTWQMTAHYGLTGW